MLKKHSKFLVLGLALSLILFMARTSFAFEKVKFAVISDTHMALHGADGMKMGASSTKIVENTVEELNKMPDLDFVVVTGDLLLDGEPWNLDLMKAYLDELRMPYYVLCGNHDYAPASQAKADKPPYVAVNKGSVIWTFQGHGFRGADAWWNSHPLPGLQIVGLDANVPIHWGGHMPLSEIKWLDRVLYGNRERVNIAFCHHNFVAWSKDDELGGKFDKFQVDNGADVRTVFEKYAPALQVVISGHRHIGLRHKEVNGVNYVVCPAAVSYPNQYTLFTVTPGELSYETKWVPIEKEIIEQAKENLLKAEWWRPTGASDEEMLALFEGPGNLLKKGSIKLQPIQTE